MLELKVQTDKVTFDYILKKLPLYLYFYPSIRNYVFKIGDGKL